MGMMGMMGFLDITPLRVCVRAHGPIIEITRQPVIFETSDEKATHHFRSASAKAARSGSGSA